MSVSEWIAVAGIVVTLLGLTIVPAWRAMGSRVERVSKDLSEHKLHVAEHYATKAGVSDTMAPIAKAVNDMDERIDKRLAGMTQRLDRVIERDHKPIRHHD